MAAASGVRSLRSVPSFADVRAEAELPATVVTASVGAHHPLLPDRVQHRRFRATAVWASDLQQFLIASGPIQMGASRRVVVPREF